MSYKVGSVQIGENYGGNQYLPYSIGVLQAYALKYLTRPKEYTFLTPVAVKVEVSDIVKKLEVCNIVFFSVYMWNEQISLKIAKELKKINNDTVVVFGGPQIPEEEKKIKPYISKYRFIDIAAFGEGEKTFLNILEFLRNRSFFSIPSICIYDEELSKPKYNQMAPRIKNIDEIPSPYLSGVFDQLMIENKDINWSALLETNRGCPFTCSFCAWGAGNKKRLFKFSLERIYEEIDWISKKKINYIFCCDSNFGIFERDIEIVKKVVDNKKVYGFPNGFSIQNTKNATDKIFNLQKLLNDAGLQIGVSLAVQSMNKSTLKSVGRKNISLETAKDLQKMFTSEKILTYSDMIIGLPEETYETFTRGISKLVANGQHNKITFINLAILENTEMANKDFIEKYELIIVESKIIHNHSNVMQKESVSEIQKLVVGTHSMPKDKWIKCRVFAWMTSLLYFDKFLQIPLIFMVEILKIEFENIIDLFMHPNNKYPTFQYIYDLFTEQAHTIQQGGSEYIPLTKFSNLYWPVDEFAMINLISENKLKSFYIEASEILLKYIKDNDYTFYEELFKEAVYVNSKLIKRPFVNNDLYLTTKYDILLMYKKMLLNDSAKLLVKLDNSTYRIYRSNTMWKDYSIWAKEVIWFGGKRGDYLYNFKKFRG